jgi:alkaline phosphatase
MKYVIVCLFGIAATANAQHTAQQIFSHNDYLQSQPLETAYSLTVGYVEADVFLRDNELLVAHTSLEIKRVNTLDKLYLQPLKAKLRTNQEKIYPDRSDKLTLMIDLKSEGLPTLNAIVEQLKKYPELTTCNTLTIAISGNVPDTSHWKTFPDFITFDGRPAKNYFPQHLSRVSFISNSFSNYSRWNGNGEIPAADLQKLKSVIASVHAQGKKIRFWGSPDVPTVWAKFIDLGVDILGTDKVEELYNYLQINYKPNSLR